MLCGDCEGDGAAPDGSDCRTCGGTGYEEWHDCPLADVTPDVWWLLFAADQARRGAWPRAGGWLEQAQSLVEAVRFVWAEEARWHGGTDEEGAAAWPRTA